MGSHGVAPWTGVLCACCSSACGLLCSRCKGNDGVGIEEGSASFGLVSFAWILGGLFGCNGSCSQVFGVESHEQIEDEIGDQSPVFGAVLKNLIDGDPRSDIDSTEGVVDVEDVIRSSMKTFGFPHGTDQEHSFGAKPVDSLCPSAGAVTLNPLCPF